MEQLPTPQPGGDRAERIEYPTNQRLARMRLITRLLDNAIVLPGGYRIGLDPLVGLLPGVGDFLASSFSLILIYDAARLGVRKRVLARMVLNVIVDSLVGSIPMLGDLFDAAWKANARNLRMVEGEYNPNRKERPLRSILGFLFLAIVLIYAAVFFAFYLVFRAIMQLFA
jgi:hypothetical protein